MECDVVERLNGNLHRRVTVYAFAARGAKASKAKALEIRAEGWALLCYAVQSHLADLTWLMHLMSCQTVR